MFDKNFKQSICTILMHSFSLGKMMFDNDKPRIFSILLVLHESENIKGV